MYKTKKQSRHKSCTKTRLEIITYQTCVGGTSERIKSILTPHSSSRTLLTCILLQETPYSDSHLSSSTFVSVSEWRFTFAFSACWYPLGDISFIFHQFLTHWTWTICARETNASRCWKYFPLSCCRSQWAWFHWKRCFVCCLSAKSPKLDAASAESSPQKLHEVLNTCWGS